MVLKACEMSMLSSADPACITQSFADLAKNWQHGRWLGVGNRYRDDCVNKIKTDTQPGTGYLRHHQMASYITASSAIHCMDGWGYVSRAMEAELSGDIGAARHLAYYAELRAAMSLLASIGVGVFSNKNFAVKADKKCGRISGKTHVFTWDALQYWADQPDAANLILAVIQPGGKALTEWLSHFPLTTGPGMRRVLAKDLLLSWGLDLKRLAEDQFARNESSYRPTSISKCTHPTLAQDLDFIKDFWRVHEPSKLNPFKELDRHLLRRSLAKSFKSNHPQGRSARAVSSQAQYKRYIEPMLHAVLPTVGDFDDEEWREFLCYRRDPNENLLIVHAESSDPVSSPTQHIQVIARATLLLRLATGAARNNLKTLGTADVDNLSFWWNPIGESKGLWEPGVPPAQFSDLWQDIDDSLDQLQTWRDAGGQSKKELFNGAARDIRSLSSCERVGLWSLGL